MIPNKESSTKNILFVKFRPEFSNGILVENLTRIEVEIMVIFGLLVEAIRLEFTTTNMFRILVELRSKNQTRLRLIFLSFLSLWSKQFV